jgi:hypothetical protein
MVTAEGAGKRHVGGEKTAAARVRCCSGGVDDVVR